MALFSGPKAEERAREYAAAKYARYEVVTDPLLGADAQGLAPRTR